MLNVSEMTDRQRRELEYHREHAASFREMLERKFDYDVITNPDRRWWNAHWESFTYLMNHGLAGKRVLVVGCGFGEDALFLAKAKAQVSAFDLSPESIEIASALSEREGFSIEFAQMAAEKLEYPDAFFDYVYARDILHHVDIPNAMLEIQRTMKPDAIFCFNEIYTHSITDTVRNSKFIDGWLYPKMTRFIYGSERPYITEDERKLTEKDVTECLHVLQEPELKKYFSCIVARVLPDRWVWLRKIDRLLLIILGPLGSWFGGRVLIAGKIKAGAK
ncbi:MAG: class I SAM-dependent methyltransferase [Pseudomonadota bacterium]